MNPIDNKDIKNLHILYKKLYLLAGGEFIPDLLFVNDTYVLDGLRFWRVYYEKFMDYQAELVSSNLMDLRTTIKYHKILEEQLTQHTPLPQALKFTYSQIVRDEKAKREKLENEEI